MVARLVAILGWAALACLAGDVLYGIGEALVTGLCRRCGLAMAAEPTEAARQRLGCVGCLLVLIVIMLAVLGRLPGGDAVGALSPAIPRALPLMVG